MNEMDIVNPFIEVDLAGHKVKVRRVPTLKRHAMIQAAWLEAAIKRLKQQAAAFADTAERMAYITGELAKLPNGSDLAKAAFENVPDSLTVDLVCQAGDGRTSRDDIQQLLDDATREEVEIALNFICGSKKKQPLTLTNSAPSAG